MKKYLLFFTLFVYTQTMAQPPGHTDTIWGGFANQHYYDGILQAPVVTGGTTAVTIVPNRAEFCFDKKIKIKSTVRGRLVEQCLYLDTKKGLTAYLMPERVAGGDMCDIKPDDEKFIFSIIGLKGNVYTYKNQRKKDVMLHWVTTGNSQTYLYQSPTPAGAETVELHKKIERRDYCNGKIKATCYKADGAAAPELFLFGKTYPANIKVSSNKYIGNFGIGYQNTDRGLFIIMEMNASSYDCKITDIEDVNICFDPTPFQIMEDEYVSKQTEALTKEREKISRDEAKAQSAEYCVSEKMAVINFRKENLRKQEENLGQSQRGNTYQNQTTQKAMIGMMDPLISVQGSILETKVSICNTNENMSRRPGDSQSYQEKISCLNSQLTRLISAEAEMKAKDIQYASSPGQAFAEKSKILLRAMSGGCN